MNARRRLGLMLLLLAASLAGTAGFTWLVNPYGRWSVAVVDRVYRSDDPSECTQLQHERTLLPYVLRQARPRVLLVGNSRIQCGLAIDPAAGDGFLNAGMRGGSVQEIAALLEVAADNPALRQVIWAADYFTFSAAHARFQDGDMPRRLRGETWGVDLATTWRRDVWDIDAYRESWRVLGRMVRRRPRLPALHPAPWPPQALRRQIGAGASLADYGAAHLDHAIREAAGIYGQDGVSPTTAETLQTAVARLRARGVAVTVVILPMSACELEIIRAAGRWDAFLAWKRELLALVGPYWDFSADSAVASDESLFRDLMHHKTPTGHAVLRRLLGEPCDECGDVAQRIAAAGVLVDAASIDEHLAAQRGEHLVLNGHCADRVPAALANGKPR